MRHGGMIAIILKSLDGLKVGFLGFGEIGWCPSTALMRLASNRAENVILVPKTSQSSYFSLPSSVFSCCIAVALQLEI
jgi:hypothetical protein